MASTAILETSDISALLLEHVPAAVAVFDRDLRYVGCSRRWLADYHLEERPILGLSHYELFPEIDESWRAVYSRALAGESLSGGGDRCERADGSVDWVSWRIDPWHDATGAIAGVILTTQVVAGEVESARVLAQRQLQDIARDHSQLQEIAANEALLRAILEAVPDAMIVIDEHGRIESFSAAAERLFGYAAAEVIGRNVSLLMPEPDASRHDFYLGRYMASGQKRIIGLPRRIMGLRKDGSTFPHTLCVGEARAGGRRVFPGFVLDLSERDEAEAKMRELQAELLHISRISALGALATTLAHELNQPLTAVTNYVQSSAELLDRSDAALPAELVREALAEAGREALRAGAIVQRLRQFISRGELERTNEAPEALVRQVLALSTLGGQSRGITCGVAAAPGLQPVLVDRVQIQQVLFNLIRNAFEAIGGAGHVQVDLREEQGWVHFTVADNGPGIAMHDEPDLFEPFQSGKEQGLGIGLSICRRIVEAHGGRLWHEAGAGGGAAFHFTVPVSGGDGADD